MTPLGRDACLDLLTQVPIGRVAVSIGALPAVRSVRFAVTTSGVVFRVAPASKLHRAVVNAVVAFHADHFDEGGRLGWSVLVRGHCEEVIDPGDVASLEGLRLESWTDPPGGDRFVRVPLTVVTGEQVHWGTPGDDA